MEFSASSVSYNEAIDGQIVQVIFEEKSNNDSLEIDSCSVVLSVNYAISPYELGIEWCDGKEHFGGVKLKRYLLSQSEFRIWMVDGTFIVVAFNTDSGVYSIISDLVKDHWDSHSV